ncbi:MAG TPA: thiaminase II [Candidatus Limnocylindrales bacterium]|nr:thiaminase II [Candidatus Limnocylindrales bacterium]
MLFTDRLRQKAAPIWEKELQHPFVKGIGDGTLPVEKFKFYMGQDYLFLIEYCRVFALAVAKAPDLPTMGKFAQLLHATLTVEMDLHRGYARKFGITPEELECTSMAPTTHAYTRHLLHVAETGTLGDLISAILPCQLGYWEIGNHLAQTGKPPLQPLYQEWIQMYSSQEFGALAQGLSDLMNTLAEGEKEKNLARMEEQFLVSSRYEYMFWEMCYREENWIV